MIKIMSTVAVKNKKTFQSHMTILVTNNRVKVSVLDTAKIVVWAVV
jgi:hypothetical protein